MKEREELEVTLTLFSWAAIGRTELPLTEKEKKIQKNQVWVKEQAFGSSDFDIDRRTDIQESTSSRQLNKQV